MKQINSKQRKRIIFLSSINSYQNERDAIERHKAYERMEKENKLENKIDFERRKCVQTLYSLEKELNKADKKGNQVDVGKIKEDFLKAIDKASADSVGRILAQIKQTCSKSKEILTVDVSVDDFYNKFEKVCVKELGEYTISQEEFDEILKPYIDVNFARIKNSSEMLEYKKAIKQLNKNVNIIQQSAVKQNKLGV